MRMLAARVNVDVRRQEEAMKRTWKITEVADVALARMKCPQ